MKESYKVGDKETFELSGLGTFTATAQEVRGSFVRFIFDDYVDRRPMNETNTNEGGYDASDLKKWIDTELLEAFPEEIRKDIFGLSIPSVGMMFGHDDEWCNNTFESDEDEQLELMKLKNNRIAYYNDNFEWGWLRNTTKKDVSAALFACIYGYGGANYGDASYSGGVRPVFWLKLHRPFPAFIVDSVDIVDNVNHPSHYETGKFECIEVMEEAIGKDAVKNFCVCNAFKYLYRAGRKNGLEDIKKANWYLNKYIELEEDLQND